MPLPRSRFAASGLLFDDSDRKRSRVFDIHTRMFYTLPPLPAEAEECLLPVVEGEGSCGDPRIGMTVDTTLFPYGFRVTVVDQVVHCWIYDSNSGAWTPEPSADVYTTSDLCFRHSEPLYMRVVDEIVPAYRFHFYELERDECECCPEPGVPEVVWEYGTLACGESDGLCLEWSPGWFLRCGRLVPRMRSFRSCLIACPVTSVIGF